MRASRGALFVLIISACLATGCSGGGGDADAATDAGDGEMKNATNAPVTPQIDPSTLPGGFPVADLPRKPITDWSRSGLLDAHAGILGCLAHQDVPADAIVAKAWLMDETRAAVRISGADGTKWHCEADVDGANAALVPFGTDPSGTFSGDLFFVPEDRERPAGEGFVHESVVDAEATFLGWLSTRSN